MVRVIAVADLGGDYHGESGADGWAYEPEHKRSKKTLKQKRPKPPVVEATPHKPTIFTGGIVLG